MTRKSRKSQKCDFRLLLSNEEILCGIKTPPQVTKSGQNSEIIRQNVTEGKKAWVTVMVNCRRRKETAWAKCPLSVGNE